MASAYSCGALYNANDSYYLAKGGEITIANYRAPDNALRICEIRRMECFATVTTEATQSQPQNPRFEARAEPGILS